MIIMYHAAKPYLPLIACYRHLGYHCEDEQVTKIGLEWDWQLKPLHIPGRDAYGATVGCLAHGRKYRSLYLRAMNGTAAIFNLRIKWVDIDQLRLSQSQTDLAAFFALSLVNYFPVVAKRYFRYFVRDFFEAHFTARQGEQR